MEIDLNKKVVIITGGAGLIGKAFVHALARANAVAVIADSDTARAMEVKEEISKSVPAECLDCVELDITSKKSIQSMISSVSTKHGKIGAIVNNAFPRNERYGTHFFEVSYEDFCEHLNANLGGYFLVSQQIALYFKDQGGGDIVNMGSIYGVVPPSFEVYDGTSMTSAVEYAGIKAGVLHLTRYMAKYLKDYNIRVNSISPGGIEDGQDPRFLKQYREKTFTKGMLDPEDIAGTLVFLLSDLSRYITGQNIIVDDGFVLS